MQQHDFSFHIKFHRKDPLETSGCDDLDFRFMQCKILLLDVNIHKIENEDGMMTT